jgi:CheY-like chemotaxis protein/HPt (histidine-containing phosphotransfer) domain-containing protein
MAREAGFAAYLHKPVKQSQLLEAISAIAARQSAREDAAAAPLITRHWLEEGRRTGTILLAEDNPVNQAVAEAILTRSGYTVVTVSDGREAVDVLSARDFDLVLMDLQMPEMNGLEATAHIRKLPGLKAKVPVIAMTAHALSGDREKCLAAGMDDYVSKPINGLELKEMVGRWIKREPGAPGGTNVPRWGKREDPPVDFERLRQSSGGDVEFERRLTELFLSDVERRYRILEESVSACREEKSSAEAHSLKGACANFGAARLAGIFSELEIRAKNGERTEMRRLCGQAGLEFKRIREFLAEKKPERA